MDKDLKDKAQMEEEITKIRSSLRRLNALHKKNQAKHREYKFDESKDKRMKRDLKVDIKKRIAKKKADRRAA